MKKYALLVLCFGWLASSSMAVQLGPWIDGHGPADPFPRRWPGAMTLKVTTHPFVYGANNYYGVNYNLSGINTNPQTNIKIRLNYNGSSYTGRMIVPLDGVSGAPSRNFKLEAIPYFGQHKYDTILGNHWESILVVSIYVWDPVNSTWDVVGTRWIWGDVWEVGISGWMNINGHQWTNTPPLLTDLCHWTFTVESCAEQADPVQGIGD